jgi:hypothetical protein
MMFFFPKHDVIQLIEHASTSQTHGSPVDDYRATKETIQPGLWLVKKKSVYLVSSGGDTPSPRVFAQGFAPDENRISGCDFALHIPLTELHLSGSDKETEEYLAINYMREGISAQWRSPAHLKHRQAVV